MEYLLAYHTDRGKRKAVNQDSLLLTRAFYHGRQIVLAVVCDGMGGYQNGELASAEVVGAFSNWFKECYQILEEREEFEDALYDSWEKLLQNEHRKIYRYGLKMGIRLGTTVTAMLLTQNNYYIAHVGDSRIYEIKNQVIQLTRDQILAGLDVKNGQWKAKAVQSAAGENVLLQGVGVSKDIRPVYCSGQIEPEAVYLLCSDGFRHKISNEEFHQAFSPQLLNSEEIMRKQGEQVAEIIMKRGERDNLTVVLIRTKHKNGDYDERGMEKRQDSQKADDFILDRETIVCYKK